MGSVLHAKHEEHEMHSRLQCFVTTTHLTSSFEFVFFHAESNVPNVRIFGAFLVHLHGMKDSLANSISRETDYCMTGPDKFVRDKSMLKDVRNAKSWFKRAQDVITCIAFDARQTFVIDVEILWGDSSSLETTIPSYQSLDANIDTKHLNLFNES